MAAIEAEKLVRTYKQTSGFLRRRTRTIEAVRGIDFEVSEGELFGLLGPNGAGKTTTIKMLVTLLIPTSGSARVHGHDVVRDAQAVRRRIGYVFGGDRGAYERLSGLDNLRYFSELYGVPAKVQKQRSPELLELVGLTGRERERVEGYSRGMRQRLHIARGLLHDPPVIVLDEPTIGLDPVGARELRHTIAELARAGKTVLLTTHYMYEADALCDRIAVIAKGEIVATGTPADLKNAVADRTVIEIEAYGAPERAIQRLRDAPGVTSVAVEDREHAQLLLVQAPQGSVLTQQLLAHLDAVRVRRCDQLPALAGRARAARGVAAALRADPVPPDAGGGDDRPLLARVDAPLGTCHLWDPAPFRASGRLRDLDRRVDRLARRARARDGRELHPLPRGECALEHARVPGLDRHRRDRAPLPAAGLDPPALVDPGADVGLPRDP